MNRTLTTADLIELFDGIDKRTVTRWCADGCPHDGGGKGKPRLFNAEEVAAWMKKRGITGAVGRPPDVEESTDPEDPLRKAKIRKETAMADRYEVMAAREKGLLMPKADVEAATVRMATVIRNRLLGLPPALAPVVVGMTVPQAEHEIDARIRDILKELSRS